MVKGLTDNEYRKALMVVIKVLGALMPATRLFKGEEVRESQRGRPAQRAALGPPSRALLVSESKGSAGDAAAVARWMMLCVPSSPAAAAAQGVTATMRALARLAPPAESRLYADVQTLTQGPVERTGELLQVSSLAPRSLRAQGEGGAASGK